MLSVVNSHGPGLTEGCQSVPIDNNGNTGRCINDHNILGVKVAGTKSETETCNIEGGIIQRRNEEHKNHAWHTARGITVYLVGRANLCIVDGLVGSEFEENVDDLP